MRPISPFELSRLRGEMQGAFHSADQNGEPENVIAEIWRDPDTASSNADDAGFFVGAGEGGQAKAFEMPCRLFSATDYSKGEEREFGAQTVSIKEWVFVFNPDEAPVSPFEIHGSDTLKVGDRAFEIIETGSDNSFNILHRVRCKEIKNG